MPEITPILGLKKTLSNETVTRAAYNENLDIIDQKAAKSSDFAAHLAETAAKHIKETGSNANGRYIRFDDGTQICYGAPDVFLQADTSLLARNWTYPAAFIDTPQVIALPDATYTNISAADIKLVTPVQRVTLSATTALLHIWRSTGSFSAGADWVLSAVAIGRWK